MQTASGLIRPMLMAIICFAAGIAWLQWQAELPADFMLLTLGLLALVAVATACVHRRLRTTLPVAAFLCGILWATLMAQWRLADALPEASEGRDIQVEGVISALPQPFVNGWRFDFTVEHAATPVPRHISLAWYRGLRAQDEADDALAGEVHAGERWRFTVRLKRPHGNLNPNGFDYEATLFEQGIRATGYVRANPDNVRLEPFVSSASNWVERLREHIRARFLSTLGDAPYVGILVALTVGDQRAIDNGLWQTFSRTGLTHLMSISGLHITMVAGLAYWLTGFLWRRSAWLPLRLPAQQVAALGGLLVAFGYCVLAGFAVPAQRTLYMLATVALAMMVRRTVSARHSLSLALLVVLLLDPWAVLAAGFWLSFGAVGLLFYIGANRLASGHWLMQWGRAQWAMTVGMIPLLLMLFQQFSLVSPLANAVAIPVVSFVITPLSLLATLPGLAFLLWPAHWITAQLMALVGFLAATPWAVWQQHAPPLWATGVALLGVLWLLLPRGVPARWVGLVLFLPLLFVLPSRPNEGDARVVVLDVGQGLAVHVQTHMHDLIFDTGPAFSPDANSGNRIIVPYLRAAGVRHLDGLVVSHQDKDHSGGAESLLESIPTDWLLSSLSDDYALSTPVKRIRCSDGQQWSWDGVAFTMLHPLAARYLEPTAKTNDMSCVLRLTTVSGSLLLPADIEARDEDELLERHRSELKSDVLLVPHHGSRTSSTAEFVTAVSSRIAVFPVGYHNRFGHPKDDVVERYRAAGEQLLRTDRDGAISFVFNSGTIEVTTERASRRRYWHGR